MHIEFAWEPFHSLRKEYILRSHFEMKGWVPSGFYNFFNLGGVSERDFEIGRALYF